MYKGLSNTLLKVPSYFEYAYRLDNGSLIQWIQSEINKKIHL